MEGYTIYPKDITEVFLGRVEIKGYECHGHQFTVNGYIKQGSRTTLYVDCICQKRKSCKILRDIIKSEEFGIKKKQGNDFTIARDLLEAIELSSMTNIKIPFKLGVVDDQFSMENIEGFFSGLLAYKTGLDYITNDSFTLNIEKTGKEPDFENLEQEYDEHFK